MHTHKKELSTSPYGGAPAPGPGGAAAAAAAYGADPFEAADRLGLLDEASGASSSEGEEACCTWVMHHHHNTTFVCYDHNKHKWYEYG